MREASENMKELLRQTASPDDNVARAAAREIAIALEQPLRKGVTSGDLIEPIFESITLDRGVSPEFPLDILVPGTEDQYVAYAVPGHGRIPEKQVDSDYFMVPTYEIGNSITWLLKYARDARWDVVQRMMEIFEAGFVKKMNDDGFHTLLAAGVDRNIIVYDSNANQGQFTKRLVSLMKVIMRRNGGGNSTSMNRGKLTDLYMSPEAIEDMRNWGIDEVDDVTRREIYTAADGSLNRVFGVNLHDTDEFGVGQVYQSYFESNLAGTMPSGSNQTVEIVLGMDMTRNDSFVMPNRGPMTVEPYITLREQRKGGVWGTVEIGFGVLDTRRVILGAL